MNTTSFIQKLSYKQFLLKRKVEDILIFPFIFLGRVLARFDPLPKEYNTFFFFPFYHTGGAEKVHALIAQGVGGADCIIFFTRKSADARFIGDFTSSGCTIKDISRYTDNKLLYFLNLILRGKISAHVNRQKLRPVVFNGQSNFGYKISPWIATDVKQVELIHSFNTFSWIRIPFLPFISKTIMISKLRIAEHLQQYQQIGIPPLFNQRIEFIQNAIELPTQKCKKNFESDLKVLFVGRGTPEKRPELFLEIAFIAAEQNLQMRFTLVGEMPPPILEQLPSNTEAPGNVNDVQRLHQLYCQHHVLIIPSSTEGFPIVLMEAMANGCAVVATPVGDIPCHLHTNKNGLLLSSTDENTVTKETLAWLQHLRNNKHQLEELCINAQEYAFKNFGIEQFNQRYKTILQPNS